MKSTNYDNRINMKKINKRMLLIIVLLLVAGPVFAQGSAPQNSSRSAPVVTASSSSERLRFTAPFTIVQTHLQVYDSLGQLLAEVNSEGNVLDWSLQNNAGARLSNGSYLTVVTVKSLSGHLSRRIGSLSIAEQQIELQPVEVTQLTAGQQQATGPTEEDAALTILKPADAAAVTALAHNGSEGQVIRSRGALSFRIGDFFSGTDTEQMRLTEDGNLGIGTTQPQARLDVAGTIRAQQVLIAKPRQTGTNSQALVNDTAQTIDGVQPLVSGTGTQNRIAKWADNAGTLGDSNIVEDTNNRVGIGTTTPGSRLHIAGAQGLIGGGTFQLDTNTLFSNWASTWPAFEVLNTNQTDNNVSLFQFSDIASGAAHAGIGAVATNHVNKFGDLFFFTKGTDGYQPRMGIYGGNVGIGTTAPGAKLEISGNALLYPASGPGSLHIRNRTNSDYSQIVFDDDANFYRAYIGYIGANAGLGARNDTVEFGTAQGSRGALGNDITFRPNETELMRLTASGRVGIGMATPSFRLHVIDPSNTGLRVQTNAPDGTVASFGGNGAFQIDAPGVAGGRFNVLENGKVGIGTATPQAKLDVRGDVKLGSTGQLFATGGEENLKIIRGFVLAGGTIKAGSGFTLTRPSTGVYSIVFDIGFLDEPAVTVTCFTSDPCVATTNGVGNSGFTINTFNQSLNPADSSFFFIAIGQR